MTVKPLAQDLSNPSSKIEPDHLGLITLNDANDSEVFDKIPQEKLTAMIQAGKVSPGEKKRLPKSIYKQTISHFWIKNFCINPIFARPIQELRDSIGADAWDRLDDAQKLEQLRSALIEKLKGVDPDGLKILNIPGRCQGFAVYQEIADLLDLSSIQSSITSALWGWLDKYDLDLLREASPTGFKKKLNDLKNQQILQSIDDLNLNFQKLQLDHLPELPQALYQVAKLTSICLDDNNLVSVPSFNQLRNLLNISLKDNKITELQGDRFPATLKSLVLEGNQIATLEGAQFPNWLERLCLAFNQISTLKNAMFPARLKSLFLSVNQISTLEGVKFSDGLQRLDLDFNEITTLKGAVFPPQLNDLYLNYNKISTLQDASFPVRVNSLHLDHNQISTLKGVIFPVERLRYLHLNNNLISALEDVAFPPELFYLYLNNNSISTLKDAKFPPQLRYLFLYNNPISTLENLPAELKQLVLDINQIVKIFGVAFPDDHPDPMLNNLSSIRVLVSYKNEIYKLREFAKLKGIELPDEVEVLVPYIEHLAGHPQIEAKKGIVFRDGWPALIVDGNEPGPLLSHDRSRT